MKRILTIGLAASIATLIASPSQTTDLRKLSFKLFDDIEAQLNQIQKSKYAAAAKSEIRLAVECLKEGRDRLAEGSLKRAAEFAERLPLHLQLIRTLLAAGAAVKEADAAETKNQKMQKALAELRLRIDRYILAHKGALADDASKPMSGNTK